MSSIKAIDAVSVRLICSGQGIPDLATGVKELIENAVDAGATKVDVKLKDNGLASFEVVDNGKGINKSDYATVCKKHYTSKIQEFQDIESVISYGFRGEALSSLCELSAKVTITTRTAEEQHGNRIEFATSGEVVKTSPVARSIGTTVTVENLFAPLIVRRKEFERSIKKQYARLLLVIQSYALISTNVQISCTDFVKGRRTQVLSTSGGSSMQDNIARVFGSKFLQEVIFVKWKVVVKMGSTSELEVVTVTDTDDVVTGSCSNDDVTHTKREGGDGSSPNINESNTVQGVVKATDDGSGTMDSDDIRDDTQHLTVASISGYVSKVGKGIGRSTNDRQFWFVNQRPVDLPKATKAVNEVWRQFEMKHKPAFILNLQIDSGGYDVNITPDKRQVMINHDTQLYMKLQELLQGLWEPSRNVFQTRTLDDMVPAVGRSTRSTAPSDQNRYSQVCIPNALATPPSPASDTQLVSMESVSEPVSQESCEESDNGVSLQGIKQTTSNFNAVYSQDSSDMSMGLCSPKKQPHKKHHQIGAENSDSEVELPETTPSSKTSRVSGTNDSRISASSSQASLQGKPFQLQSTTLRNSSTRSVVRNKNNSRHGVRSPSILSYSPPQLRTDSPAMELAQQSGLQKEADEEHGASVAEETVGESVTEAQDDQPVRAQADNTPIVEKSVQLSEIEEQVDQPGSDKQVQVSGSEKKESGSEKLVPGSEKLVSGSEKKVSGSDKQEEIQDLEEQVEQKTHEQVLVKVGESGLPNLKRKRLVMNLESTENIREVFEAQLQASNRNRTQEQKSEPRFSCSVDEISNADNSINELERHFCKTDFVDAEILGQFNLGFIVARVRNDLFILDQHACDEKYRFETLQTSTKLHAQKLIRPLPIELSAMEEQVVQEYMDVFEANGFKFSNLETRSQSNDLHGETHTKTKLFLTTIPHSQKTQFGAEDVHELASILRSDPPPPIHLRGENYVMPRLPRLRAMFASRACRSAIMIGKHLRPHEMRRVVSNMAGLDQPWNCPHGRPTMRHLVDLVELSRTHRGGEQEERTRQTKYLRYHGSTATN